MNALRASGRRQRGLSLVEASVSLVIMGVAATALWQGARGAIVDENLAKARANADRAERALVTFVALNGRFPCPAFSEKSGLERCDEFLRGELPKERQYYPFLTTGLPEAEAGRLRYTVDRRAVENDGDFQVLANVQPITATSNPRALPVTYRRWGPPTFDRTLDICEVLTRMGKEGSPVYTLELDEKDNLLAGQLVGGEMIRRINAPELAVHLRCSPLVSLAGRSQFRAHLTGAIMAKAIQDYRVQTQIGYATYVMDLAEGAWNVTNGLTNSLRGWAKIPQAGSAMMANMYSNPAPAIANFLMAFTTQVMGTAALGARLSNLARFSNNLRNFKDHLRILNGLVEDALERYAIATRHAQMGASSAYFLNEQTFPPPDPASLGPASDYGPNGVAQRLNTTALDRARQLGQPGDVADAVTWPSDRKDFNTAPFIGPLPSGDGNMGNLQ